MTQPVWQTNAGSLGLFPENINISFQLVCNPTSPAITITYQLLNGSLPSGVVLTNTGLLQGIPGSVSEQTRYAFTVRAIDNLGNFRDRTFSISIANINAISISTLQGTLFSVLDSTYVDYQLEVYNPDPTISYQILIASGTLPPGLQMDLNGRIKGYAQPPLSDNQFPITKTFSFTVQLLSSIGTDYKDYSIIVVNQRITNPPNTRKPTILNRKPLSLPVDEPDPYYGYYLLEGSNPATVKANEYFTFKVIGYDFDNVPLLYSYSALPKGLVGDPVTGWISGVPVFDTTAINKYQIKVAALKSTDNNIRSDFLTFDLVITNGVDEHIVWSTPENLGTVYNGTASNLYVEATSARTLSYKLENGELPPNLQLLDNGRIVGQIPFEPKSSLSAPNQQNTYTFTISAYITQYPVVISSRTFTLTIEQRYTNPVDILYFKATPNIQGRQIINSLLTNESLIPSNLLYRPDDIYFGKATDVTFVHTYGIESTSLPNYLNSISLNYYNRKVVLGELKTAIAKNSNNEIVYEVVYSEIIDDLENPNGVSIPEMIEWPRRIQINNSPYFVTNTEIYTSEDEVFTSYSAEYITKLYPASINNMRQRIVQNLAYNDDQNLLPLWMTSQQNNGNTLGFTKAWVICYTLPGQSETIKNNINNNWQYTLNQIDFSIDRFLVDKSATYDYNTDLAIPGWKNFPSATPTPSPLDTNDLAVLFPRKTILPDGTAS